MAKVADVRLDLKQTELCLGLPGGGETAKNSIKRCYSETITDLNLNLSSETTDPPDISKKLLPRTSDPARPPASKAQVVGWPPVRSYRKNVLGAHVTKNTKVEEENLSGNGASFVKVSMDGAPYLRKVDLKMYKSYQELSDALCKMFSAFTIVSNCGSQGMKDFMNENKLIDSLSGSKFMPTYEDKDGDWMLVGDVPWEMFVDSCKRLRIMKESDAIGLSAPRAAEKYKTRT